MFTSIQQFNEKGIEKLESLIEKFLKEPKNMASFVTGVRDVVIRLGLDIIGETITDCNNMLRNSGKRKASWVVVKAEAVETSYSKAGEVVLSDSVSRQTVKNKVHGLVFDKGDGKILEEKKKVEYLYIDANEELWVEVSEYIESHYDLESIKAIHINGDGANWIKAGAAKIVGAKIVLDGYHLRQTVNRIASRILDGQGYKNIEFYECMIYNVGEDGACLFFLREDDE